MDERNENTNFENAAAAPVENNIPAPEPAPVAAEKQPKKTTKDFTPEERKAIVARAAKIDLSRAAKEFNTSWQAIAALQKAAQREKLKAKQKPAKAKLKVNAAPKNIKRSNEFSQKEKDAILAKARIHGFREVAAEFGTNWQTLASWNKQQRNMAAALASDKTKAKTQKASGAVSATTAKKPSESSSKSKNMSAEELGIENAILKEKVAILTQQVEKLRNAVGNLA